VSAYDLETVPTYCHHCDEEYAMPEGCEKCIICEKHIEEQCDICGDYHDKGSVPRECETGDGI